MELVFSTQFIWGDASVFITTLYKNTWKSMESRSCRKALFVFKDNSFVFKDKWIVCNDKVVLKVVPFCSILFQCRINKMDTNTYVSTSCQIEAGLRRNSFCHSCKCKSRRDWPPCEVCQYSARTFAAWKPGGGQGNLGILGARVHTLVIKIEKYP